MMMSHLTNLKRVEILRGGEIDVDSEIKVSSLKILTILKAKSVQVAKVEEGREGAEIDPKSLRKIAKKFLRDHLDNLKRREGVVIGETAPETCEIDLRINLRVADKKTFTRQILRVEENGVIIGGVKNQTFQMIKILKRALREDLEDFGDEM